jgi:hypothetical protein
VIVFLGIPSIRADITFLESLTLKSFGENDPRKFADGVALRIANALGVRYLALGSGAVFKRGEGKGGKDDAKHTKDE